MSTSRPAVSVVVPCYRYGRFLDQCVSSILQQQGVEVQILIIDDASPDDSFQIAMRLSESDPRVQVRRHDANLGHIATYNEGLLEWATCEYSVLISADDVLVDGALARAVDVLERYPNVGFVYGHTVSWVDDRPLPPVRKSPSGIRIWEGHDWIRTVCRLGHNIVTCPEVVVRTSLQRTTGGYRPDLPHTADLQMWLRLAARADVAYIEGADQAFYRIHSANMTRSRSPAVDLAQRALAFESFFIEDGGALHDVRKLSRHARREIAREALWCARRAYEKGHLDQTPVVQLKQIASETYPDVRRLVEYWGLRWSELMGPSIAPYLPLFVLSTIHRRVRSALWWRRWHRKGY